MAEEETEALPFPRGARMCVCGGGLGASCPQPTRSNILHLTVSTSLFPWLHLFAWSEGHGRTVTGLGREQGPAVRAETRQKGRETHFPNKFSQAPSGGWQGGTGLAPPSGQSQLGHSPRCLPSFHQHWPSDPCKGLSVAVMAGKVNSWELEVPTASRRISKN